MKNILAENMLRFGSKNLSVASTKKLQRLAEAAAQPNKDNITMLVDKVITPARKKVTPIISDNGLTTDVITFPENPDYTKPTDALYSGEGVILYLDKGCYIVSGLIGQLDVKNNKITNPTNRVKLLRFDPVYTRNADTGAIENLSQGEGNPVLTKLSLQPVISAENLALIATTIYGNDRSTVTLTALNTKLLSFAKVASAYGFVLPGEDITTLNTALNQGLNAL